MAKKTLIEIIEDSELNGTETLIKLTDPIPAGLTVVIREFGGVVVASNSKEGYVKLQWGSDVPTPVWQTIRAGTGFFNLHLNKDFVGDGVKRFRIIRENKASQKQVIVAWLDALIHDQ